MSNPFTLLYTIFDRQCTSFVYFASTTLLSTLLAIEHSGRSRPPDKEGGTVSKNFFSALGASICSKKGGAPLLDPPLEPPVAQQLEHLNQNSEGREFDFHLELGIFFELSGITILLLPSSVDKCYPLHIPRLLL